MTIITKIKESLFNVRNQRSKLALKNIIYGFGIKGLSIVLSLLLVSITINYVKSSIYGVWITLTSIISWFSFFDLGLTNGFRNKFAESMANKNYQLAREYVSTTWMILIAIFSLIFICFVIVNNYLDWCLLLNIKDIGREEMQKTANVVVFFFSLQMILSISNTILTADQKPALSALIRLIGQAGSFAIIYIFTLTVTASLVPLAYAISGVPVLVMLMYTCWMFMRKYRFIFPRIRDVNFRLFHNIFDLGLKFFIIQITILVIFQASNVVISRILGPEYVTRYNVTYKYINVAYMIYSIILIPFWSAFTEAYTNRDYKWMKHSYKILSSIQISLSVLIIILVLISPLVYRLWLGGNVEIPMELSIVVGIYVFISSRAGLYMQLINGIGKVLVQLIIYSFCALVSLPIMVIACKNYGIIGIVIVMSFVMLLQAISGHVQLRKLLNNSATGIWNK